MRKLKVFGGTLCGGDRSIIACYSLKNCADTIEKIEKGYGSYHYIKNYWTETGNQEEIKIALANPFALITFKDLLFPRIDTIKKIK